MNNAPHNTSTNYKYNEKIKHNPAAGVQWVARIGIILFLRGMTTELITRRAATSRLILKESFYWTIELVINNAVITVVVGTEIYSNFIIIGRPVVVAIISTWIVIIETTSVNKNFWWQTTNFVVCLLIGGTGLRYFLWQTFQFVWRWCSLRNIYLDETE